MFTKLSGTVLKLGDDINTDVIYPGKYIMIYEPGEMKEHLLEGLGEHVSDRVQPGTIIIAGENFGCGSSREQAAGAIQAAGVPIVVAKSFARIFFRNAVNYGLLLITCPEAVNAVGDGEEMAIDISLGKISTGGEIFSFPPLPDFLMEIIEAGGLVAHGKKIIAARKAAHSGDKK